MNISRSPLIMALDMNGWFVSIHANGLRIFMASDLDIYWWSYERSSGLGHSTLGM